MESKVVPPNPHTFVTHDQGVLNGRKAGLASAIARRAMSPNYASRRLKRIRAQLEWLDDHMESLVRPNDDGSRKTIDEQAVERTARASGALSDLEQRLAMRPGPGTLKPTAVQPKAKSFPPPE